MHPLLAALQTAIFKLEVLISIFCGTRITLEWTTPPYPPFLDLLPRYALPINIGIFSTPPHFQYFEDYIPPVFVNGGVQTMDQLINATILFNNSNVNITVEGQRHLDAVVGSENSKREYVNELVRD